MAMPPLSLACLGQSQDLRAIASGLSGRLRQACAGLGRTALGLALLLAAPAAWSQVELQVQGTVASGGLAEVRYRFTERPTADWRFTVDEAEGGTFAITRSGSVFYRAPRVAEPRTFHIRFSDSRSPQVTAVCQVQVQPGLGQPAASASGSGPQDAAPAAAADAQGAAPAAAADTHAAAPAAAADAHDAAPAAAANAHDAAPAAAANAHDAAPAAAADAQDAASRPAAEPPGPATLLLDWDSLPPNQRDLRNASALVTAVCYLARDLGRATIDPLQVLSADPEVLGSAAPKGGAELWPKAFEEYPYVRVPLDEQGTGTLGPGALGALQRRVGPGRLLVLVSARPLAFLGQLQGWVAQGGATLVVVEVTGEPDAQDGAPARGVHGEAPQPFLTFRLQDLPHWLPSFAAPRADLAGLQRSLEAQALAPRLRQLATAYLARQRRFATWREEATVKARVPSVGFIDPSAGPTPVRIILDWDTLHVAAKDIDTLFRGLRAFVMAGRAGLDPSPGPIQIHGSSSPDRAALAAMKAAGCQFPQGQGGGKASRVRFGLQLALEDEGLATDPARALICLAGGSRALDPVLTGLAMKGHRILTVVTEQHASVEGRPLGGLLEASRVYLQLPHMEAVAANILTERQTRKAGALEQRTAHSCLRFARLELAPGGGEARAPHGLCLDAQRGTLLCLDGGDLWQYHLRQRLWTNLTALSASLNPEQGLPPLRSVAVGPTGRLYGATQDGRLLCVDREQRYRSTVMSPAWAGPDAAEPAGADQLCLDAGHRLWFSRPGAAAPLACLELDRPLPDGRYPAQAIPASALLAQPAALALAADGHLLYADEGARLFGRMASGPEGWRPELLAAWPPEAGAGAPHYRAMAGDTDGSLVCLDEGDGSLHRLSPRASLAPPPPQDGPWVWSGLRTVAVPGPRAGVRPSLCLGPHTAGLFLARGGQIGALTLEVGERQKEYPSLKPRWKQSPCASFPGGTCRFQYHPELCPFQHGHPAAEPAEPSVPGSPERAAAAPASRPAVQGGALILVDAQNHPLPQHQIPDMVRALRAFGGASLPEASVVRVFLTNHPGYESRRDAFKRAGCEVVVVSDILKDSVDKSILLAIKACCDAFDPAQALNTLCLVSADIDFLDAMRRARDTGYRVRLVYDGPRCPLAQDPLWEAVARLHDLPEMAPLARLKAERKVARVQASGQEDYAWEPLVPVDQASTRPEHAPGGIALEAGKRLLVCDGPLLKSYDLEHRLLSTVALPTSSMGGTPDLLEVAVTGPGEVFVAHADGGLESVDLDRGQRRAALAYEADTGRAWAPKGLHLCLDRQRRLWFTELPGHRLGCLDLARPDDQGRWPVRFLHDPLLRRPTLKGLDGQGDVVCWDESLPGLVRVRTDSASSTPVVLLHRWPGSCADGPGAEVFAPDGEGGLLVACQGTGNLISIDLRPGPDQGRHRPILSDLGGSGTLAPMKIRNPTGLVRDAALASFYSYSRTGLRRLSRKAEGSGPSTPPVPLEAEGKAQATLPPLELLAFKTSLSRKVRALFGRQGEAMQATIMKEVHDWFSREPNGPDGQPAHLDARVVRICTLKNQHGAAPCPRGLDAFKAQLTPSARAILEEQEPPMQARIMKEVQDWIAREPNDRQGHPANLSVRVVHICKVKKKQGAGPPRQVPQAAAGGGPAGPARNSP